MTHIINKIAVIGLGYVGCAISVLLSQKKSVVGFDKDAEKINVLKRKKSPIKDQDLEEFLNHKVLVYFF